MLNVANAGTPAMLMHGENDNDVPVAEGAVRHRAARRRH